MKNKLILIFIFTLFFINIYAFNKDKYQKDAFYIGDLIELEITKSSLSSKKLLGKFKDFEIANHKKDQNGIHIFLRRFKTGRLKLKFGKNKYLLFETPSALDLFTSKDILDINNQDRESALKRPDFLFPYIRFFIAFLILFLLLCLYIFYKIFKKLKNKKDKELPAFLWYQNFIRNLPDQHFFIALTHAFKGYLDRKFNLKIIGKTSSEILLEIKKHPLLDERSKKLKEWLSFLDLCKYTGYTASEEEKYKSKRLLEQMVQKWEEENINV